MSTEIFRENLAYIMRTERGLADMREAQFAEIARHCGHVMNVPEITELYHTLFPGTPLFSVDFARFCRYFSSGNRWNMGEMDEIAGDDGEEENSRTAYMQNGYTDRAWRQFAGQLSLTAEYFTGYTAVCEEVYYGRSRYCILPLHTSADGLLISFRKLIGKYDLQICMETQVEMADESVMRFGLLRRGLTLHPGGKTPEKMDLTVLLPDDGKTGVLFTACETLGAVVAAAYTVPYHYGEMEQGEYGDQSPRFCLELGIAKADLDALGLFLEGSQIRYTVEGIYITV